MTKETKDKIAENNKIISELLKENEALLRKEGYDPPLNNYVLPKSDLISFPPGYIRTVAKFNEKFHLREIFPNKTSRHNVTYALEVSDLLNYIFNRVHIWGAVEIVFYKLAIVNLVSIMESIILESANNICCNARACKKTKTCSIHFNKNERENARLALKRLVLLDILDFDESKLEHVQNIIDLRNRIHIRLTHGNEMQLEDYNVSLYNDVIKTLQDIDEQIYLKGVPMYRCNRIKRENDD